MPTPIAKQPTRAGSTAEALQLSAELSARLDQITQSTVQEVFGALDDAHRGPRDFADRGAEACLALARRLAHAAAEIAIERGADHPERARLRAAAELARLVAETVLRSEVATLIEEADRRAPAT